MYENIIIDDTSVYEVDEQCRKCKNNVNPQNVNNMMSIQADRIVKEEAVLVFKN
ncbi:MAG: hypothetical protein ACI4EV_08165 [Lachnospiraceae bacterium]